MLKDTIHKYPIISGIDLDIEEEVNITNVKMLIKRIHNDFGNTFIITMAPVSTYIEEDRNGMGGFKYIDLYNSSVGQYIHYFNVQFYYDFSEDSYDNIIKKGFPVDKIVMGTISSINHNIVQHITSDLYKKYGDEFGGVYIWEYVDSSNDENPYKWALDMKQSMTTIIESSVCVIC